MGWYGVIVSGTPPRLCLLVLFCFFTVHWMACTECCVVGQVTYSGFLMRRRFCLTSVEVLHAVGVLMAMFCECLHGVNAHIACCWQWSPSITYRALSNFTSTVVSQLSAWSDAAITCDRFTLGEGESRGRNGKKKVLAYVLPV